MYSMEKNLHSFQWYIASKLSSLPARVLCILDTKKRYSSMKGTGYQLQKKTSPLWLILLEEMRRHLGFTKLCKQWDKLPINWCRISAINSSRSVLYYVSLANRHFTTSSVRPQDCLISKPMNFDQFLVSWKNTDFSEVETKHSVYMMRSLENHYLLIQEYTSLVGSFNPFEKY